MKLIRDTALIFSRSLQKTARNPVWILFGMFQPLCFLLLFAPLLEKLSGNPAFGQGNSLTIFVPGLLIMLALFGTSFVGFGLIDEIREGVIERFRVTPISRSALLLGKVLRDIFVLLLQSIFLIILAWCLGLSASIIGVVLSLALVMLIGFTMSTISYSAAMILRNEDALAPSINFFLLPLQLLAGITLPLTLAPDWLQRIAALNPLSHAVTAARALFVADFGNMAIVWGFGAMIIAATLVFYGAVNLFKKAAQ